MKAKALLESKQAAVGGGKEAHAPSEAFDEVTMAIAGGAGDGAHVIRAMEKIQGKLDHRIRSAGKTAKQEEFLEEIEPALSGRCGEPLAEKLRLASP